MAILPPLSPWQGFKQQLLDLCCPVDTITPKTSARAVGFIPGTPPIRVVCLSDTHDSKPDVPDGDLLIHAGDMSEHGTVAEVQAQLDWLASLPHKYKVVIAGNHDRVLEPEIETKHPRLAGTLGDRQQLNFHDLIYLVNERAFLDFDINGVRRTLSIYGSPYTKACGSFAFQYLPIRDVWKDTIPANTDIFVTHGGPAGYLNHKYGCVHQLREVRRMKPRAIVCGHIHEGRGVTAITNNPGAVARDGFATRNIPSLLSVLFAIFSRLLFKTYAPQTLIVNAASTPPFRAELPWRLLTEVSTVFEL